MSFVNHPLDKLLNRENIFSRVERLEGRTGARPSARAKQLGQIAANTGDLLVDGKIEVVNRTAGVADVTIDDFAVWVRNQEGEFAFQDTAGNIDTIALYSAGDDYLEVANQVGDKGIRFRIDTAAHAEKLITFRSDGIVLDTGMVIYLNGGSDAIAYGTYTATLTNTTNVSSSSGGATFKYTRVGSIVTVSGQVSVTPTAAASTATALGISLPVASDIAAATDLHGNATAQATGTVGNVTGDSTNDRATLNFLSPTVGAMTWKVMFMYTIL